jgi:tripartite-type tricarboxylate transporter receptor subunit TctC
MSKLMVRRLHAVELAADSRNDFGRTFLSSIALKMLAVGVLTTVSVVAQAPPAHAQSDFYAGKTIRIVVGATAGGGYDIYARAIAPFLSAHLPGKPNVIVQNMPGGGGLTSVLYLDANAPKDGTVVTTFNSGVLTDAFTSQDKAKVDLRTIGWLGSANRSIRFCYFWRGSGFKTWDDLSGSKLATMGAIGVNSGAYNDIAILKNLMKKNVRPILGYPGRSEVHLSIERGELDGECGSKEGMPENWIRDKKIDIVVRLLQAKSDDNPEGVPRVGDFLKDPQDLEVLRLLTTAMDLGRPFVASRQVPPQRLAILQNAFAAALQDKAFLEVAKQRNMDISLVTGKAAQELVTRVLDAPKVVADKAKDIIK